MTELTFGLLGLGLGGLTAMLAMAIVIVHRGSGVLNFATGAEEVEVRGVDVIGREVGLPGDAGARPAIVKACDAAVVEANGPPRPNAPGQQPLVNHGDDAEDDDWNSQPPSGE